MKRLTALLLALIMAFSLVACNKNDEKDCKHADKDSDGVCDKCDEKMEDDEGNTDDEPDPPKGQVLTAAIIAQLGKAKSLKMEFGVTVSTVLGNWTEYDENGNPTEPYLDEMNGVEDISGTLLVVRNGKGFNAVLDVSSRLESRDGIDEEDRDYIEEAVTLYLIDGIIYKYFPDAGVYLVETRLDQDEIEGMLSAAFEGVSIDKEKATALIAKVTDELMKELKLGEGASVNIDLAKEVNDIIAFLKGIDPRSDSLEKIIDGVLSSAGSALTAQVIVNKLDELSALTVNEALEKLDEWLTREYKTTLQGIYDKIIANANVQAIIRNRLKLMGCPEDELDALLSEYKSLKLSELISEAELSDVTIYELIAAYASPSDDAPARNELFEEIRSTLKMTLYDFEIMTGKTDITYLISILCGTKVNQLSATAGLKLTKDNEIERISLGSDVAFDSEMASSIDGKQSYISYDASLYFILHSISEKEISVKLPADARRIENIEYTLPLYRIDENGSAVPMMAYATVQYYPGSICVFFDNETTGTTTIAQDIPYSALDGFTVTIAPEYFESAEITDDLTLTFDPEEYIFILTSARPEIFESEAIPD